ncbi:PREDICTED: uncharacterized protein LOC106304755 isoform X2 [Brassica oleracea var. oleracea]|uniref:uncharacterized protein LOC106304755 isoform X2 n=1 Tax=Brassica oleracea var. oleracea TaxID=109376 RepID=UPI0006A6AADD|nr:PREDICTED: uncharacterized protein LOC106304755 isoform X2 [Brassica oleracea var. oleracea]
MFSKTSSRNYEDDYSGSCLKKQKRDDTGRRRVPRRGPGVAELEQIRLEEQQISTASPLPPPEKPPSVGIIPTTTKRTGPVYPFSSYLSTGSFPDDLIPPPPVFQRNHDESFKKKRNHDESFLHSPTDESTKSTMLSVYRAPFKPNILPTQCLSFSRKRKGKKKEILSSKGPSQFIAETRKCNVRPTLTIPRDGKQIKSLDQKLKIHFQDSGTTIRYPITTDSPSPATLLTQPIMPNFSLDFPHFIHKEGFNHDIMPQRNGTDISSSRKPFYSFLPANEQRTRYQDLSFRLKTESTDHGIDLRLML